MAKSKILKGIASLFTRKGKDVVEQTEGAPSRIFTDNLVDTFGEKEVKEGIRIIDNKYKNPELEKLFFREGESKADELVNLLEARYMGSTRLQAHPLSFNRRGPGAADRYLKLNETGERLTDMPGGPGDRVLYFKHYGEMGDTVIDGKKVYDTPPSILEEGTRITDEGALIEGKAVQDSLYEKSIADMPLINRMMKETGKTETEIREAIADIANEAYEAGSPKRMSAFDDDSMRAFVTNRETIPGDKEDFVTEMMERLGEGPTTGRTASVQRKMDDMIAGMTDESDAILQNMKKMEAEAKAMTEIAGAEQAEIGQAIDAFNRMMDAGDDPAEALQFLQDALKKTRTRQADGGRVGMLAGGSLIGKGIVQAAKLAQRGIKPFGQKQTYKQKVITKGVGEQQFNEIYDQFMNKIPDEIVDEPSGKALHTGLLEAEAVMTGQKLGLLNQEQRAKIAYAMTDKIKRQIYDNPVSGLNNDYLEYMDDAIDRMESVFEIYELGGDITPKPIFDGKEIIGAQVDFSQLEKLRNQPPTKEFLDFLRGAPTPKPGRKTPPYGTKEMSNVIPFKPREKKYTGGIAGLLKKLLKRAGMDAPDKIADKKQIENVMKDPRMDLERRLKDDYQGPRTPEELPTIDELRDMVQRDPRYNKLTQKQMDLVIQREAVRQDFAYNMGVDPEEVTDDIVDMLMMEGYTSRFMFSDGGAAYINKATLEAIRDKPLRSRGARMPYVNKMQSDMEKYIKRSEK